MSIQGEITEVSKLDSGQKDAMFSLMYSYYANTNREAFDHDLSEKNWVLMLTDKESGKIAGFSTQMLFPFTYKGKELGILFSGDTIIQKEHWGSLNLSLLFGQLMIRLSKEHGGMELYWLLISKGLRTYKFLPTFFLEYYPCFDKPTPPAIRDLMDQLGESRYPGQYDREHGIVKAKDHGQFLKEEFQAEAKASKKHEEFYYNMNPGYNRGDELLCITRLSIDNINPFIKRLISKYL